MSKETITAKDRFFVYKGGSMLMHRFNTHEEALSSAKEWAASSNDDDYFVGHITEIVHTTFPSQVTVIK